MAVAALRQTQCIPSRHSEKPDARCCIRSRKHRTVQAMGLNEPVFETGSQYRCESEIRVADELFSAGAAPTRTPQGFRCAGAEQCSARAASRSLLCLLSAECSARRPYACRATTACTG